VSTSGASSGVVRVTTTLPAAGDELNGVAKSLVAKDDDLWGPEAQPEAAVRLGWLDLPESSQALLPRLRALHERFTAAGLDHVVLAGMGGSSLAPEVITRTAGAELTVLDSTDPHQVGAALAEVGSGPGGEALDALEAWLRDARRCEAPGLEGEAEPWLDQAHAESRLGLLAVKLIRARSAGEEPSRLTELMSRPCP